MIDSEANYTDMFSEEITASSPNEQRLIKIVPFEILLIKTPIMTQNEVFLLKKCYIIFVSVDPWEGGFKCLCRKAIDDVDRQV